LFVSDVDERPERWSLPRGSLALLEGLFHYSDIYEVLPKSPRNWNAARQPFVIQLCAARYRELYHFMNHSAKRRSAVGKYVFFLCMKLKLKGRCFDSIEKIQTESQDAMKTLTQNDFRSWKSLWESLQKGTTSKGMETNRNLGKWLSYSRGISGTLGSISYFLNVSSPNVTLTNRKLP